ncbi:hypothetical protein A6B35_31715 (plasmid) [Mesorhizobium amorphae CCNWGS0123]|nr:hypothetical protein A6B35_31715 [Mesorhizobium amorphae CCNWGS0123]
MRFFKSTLPRNRKTIRDVVDDNFVIVRPGEFRFIGQTMTKVATDVSNNFIEYLQPQITDDGTFTARAGSRCTK